MSPIRYFETVWSRCESLSQLYAYLVSQGTAILQPDELLRAIWVARVAALDLYIHELVAQRMLMIFTHDLPVTKAFGTFELTVETVNRIGNAENVSEASAAFDLEVRQRLSLKTFQAPDRIADGVRLVSDVKLWHEVSAEISGTKTSLDERATELKRELALIVDRRNKIAHQGDLRPNVAQEPWPIRREDVDRMCVVVGHVVRAIDTVIWRPSGKRGRAN